MENQKKNNPSNDTENKSKTSFISVLMIIFLAMVIVVGMMVFAQISGMSVNIAKSIRENGVSFSSVWNGIRAASPAKTEPETEPEAEELPPAEGNTGTQDISHHEGGAVYTRDSVTYIRSDINVKDDELVDSEDPAYRVRVNLACQCVTVYKIINEVTETPVRVFPCSTARKGHDTPEGIYPLLETYDWCFLEDGSYAQYAMRIGGEIGDGYMFHTVPYTKDKKDSLEWYEYNKLGNEASLGCIRVPAGEMVWLREHVSTGGEVVIYSDINNPGALGMPETYYIPEEVTEARGWDPTDPDPENPWHSYDFTLKVPDEISVKASPDGLDITEYADVEDSYGYDLSGYIKYQCGNDKYGFSYSVNNYDDPADYTDSKGNVDVGALIEIGNRKMDISRPGTYEIRISVSIGPLSASRTIPLIVTE